MFVTSTKTTGNFGGTTAADSECANLATSAGLSGGFKSWLSTSTVNAVSRLGTPRGFVRTDGKPFADRLTDIVAGKILNPLALDESGADAGVDSVWTGTMPDGTLAGFNCADWSNGSGNFSDFGSTTGGPGAWTDRGIEVCSTSGRFYCFETDFNVALTVSPAAGRRAFVSKANFAANAGIAAADTICANEAAGAGLAGTFQALLAQNGASAASRFDLAANSMQYVRPDGVLIADAPTIAAGAALDSGIWQNADGTYPSSTGIEWTGASTPSTVGTAGTTCSNWTSNSGSAFAITGMNQLSDPTWWNTQTFPCNNLQPVYCLEQ